MKKNFMLLAVRIIMALSSGAGLFAQSDADSAYGHISYLEGNPAVLRADATRETAIVNLPLIAGDELTTDSKSKIEFQFDNGSVMRLGTNSRVKITTILAESLTSRWKITTVELLEGKLYSINQSYNQERFQILTPNAAVQLKNNSKTTIETTDGETRLFVDDGKVQIMFGGELKNLKTETIKENTSGFMVGKDNQLLEFSKRDIDFQAWNEHIDNNFKELHYGVSKVPEKLYKSANILVKWAEKWSSAFGEWIYDDIFGYVWKPADEQFAFSARPFFHARHVTVNNELFLVPSEPWGWVPAHLGTWVWMDWGWTWIPGSTFSNGFNPVFPNSPQFQTGAFFSSNFIQWIYYMYGDIDLYYIYRAGGLNTWRESCEARGLKGYSEPRYKNVPKDIKAILSKLDKTPVETLRKRLGKVTPEILAAGQIPVEARKTTLVKANEISSAELSAGGVKTVGAGSPLNSRIQKQTMAEREEKNINALRDVKLYRNFNPDSRWAQRRGVTITANPHTNEFVCPELNISSRTLTISEKMKLMSFPSRLGSNIPTSMLPSQYSGDNSGQNNNSPANSAGIAGRVDQSGSSSSKKEKK